MDSYQKRQPRLPSVAQWSQLYRVLTPAEKVLLPGLLVLFLISFFSLANGLYKANTALVPARGGEIVEGMVGSPRFLNPVYADTNDVDRDLIQPVYSGILQYNDAGELVEDLAAAPPEITEGGKVITVSLKENVKWHDGTPFTADDVLFTVATIQDAAFKSPIRANWIGVDVEKVSDYTVKFHLLDPYAPFLERLTLKILPLHIWGEVPAENFAITPLNLQPIGTGPYRLTKINQSRSGTINEIRLTAYEHYHGEGPFVESFVFRFFESEENILREANRGTLQSFSLHSIDNLEQMSNPVFEPYAFRLPRYFALFFNVALPADQSPLGDLPVRQALQLLTDKQELAARVLNGNALLVHSPFLPSLFGLSEPSFIPQPNRQEALALLQQHSVQLSGEALSEDLEQGDTGQDVTSLQQCLAEDTEVYPEGIVNGTFGPLTKQAVVRFQEKYAAEVLAPLDLSAGTGKAGPLTRDKLNALCFAAQTTGDTLLSLTISTVNQSPLREVAQELKRQWEAAGLAVEVETFSAQELERDVIKPRAYEALLFGEVLGTVPDPFPFWHSAQTESPGLNLSRYENKALDKLLESARRELDEEKRTELFTEAQNLLLQDVPALFLYDVPYQYFASKEIQGIQTPMLAEPSQRFAEVAKWFIKTKRARP